ncbi:30S ribosomal protein S6 [Candidatus Saccharibacteria bacterium]|nr:30S ribosomal protein S6 [Candidatus Saccharibacteria bacterium]
MRDYELTVLFAPESESEVNKALEGVKKLALDNGGKIKSEDNWGRKKLAYAIRRQEFATYVFMVLELPAGAPVKISGILNITPEVLRYLLVKVDEKTLKRLAASKAKMDKES